MSKTNVEIASDIVCELIRTKGQIIAVSGNTEIRKDLIDKHLSDEIIGTTLTNIIKVLDEVYN